MLSSCRVTRPPGMVDRARSPKLPLWTPVTLPFVRPRLLSRNHNQRGITMKLIATGTLALALAANIAQPGQALAWGDDGHKVVALIAQSFLQADVRKRVNALLAADTDDLTAHDIASAADVGGQVPGCQFRRITAENAPVALRRYRDHRSGPRQGLLQSPRPADRHCSFKW